jgi:hypothetical protein
MTARGGLLPAFPALGWAGGTVNRTRQRAPLGHGFAKVGEQSVFKFEILPALAVKLRQRGKGY